MTLLQSAPLEIPPGIPRDLPAALQWRMESAAATTCTEIDSSGQLTTIALRQLFAHSTAARSHLDACEPDTDVIICVESYLHFLPAMWGALLSRRNVLPLHFQSLGGSRNFAARLASAASGLNNPVVFTTYAIKERLGQEAFAPFARILFVDHLGSKPSFPTEGATSSSENGKTSYVLVQTSGATGEPKLAAISYDAVLHRVIAAQGTYRRESILDFSPLDGIGGVLLLWPKAESNAYFQPQRFTRTPIELLLAAERLGVKGLALSSSLAARITDALASTDLVLELSTLTTLGFGMEQIVPGIVANLCDALARAGAGRLKVTFGYGMTETGLVCATQPLSAEKVTKNISRRDGQVSVGSCVPDYALRIIADDGTEAADRQPGNIEVWSPTRLFSGYYDKGQVINAPAAANGWFKTGDLGFIDDGELTITGREKSIVIVNGRNISLDQIEATLRILPGIRGALIAAAPVRSPSSATDELAVFFVPSPGDDISIEALCSSVTRVVTSRFGINVKHFVPVPPGEFPTTATGKVRRNALISGFEQYIWQPWVRKSGPVEAMRSPMEVELAEIWRRVLRLEGPIGRTANFYDLGGDSLTSAELIFAVETQYNCEIPIESFFAAPTIATMAAILPVAPRARHATRNEDLLRTLEFHTASWRAPHVSPSRLVCGFNLTCDRGIASLLPQRWRPKLKREKPPFYWICQSQSEAASLAAALGSNQPLYAMRSLVGIVNVRGYTNDILDAVASRYFDEISSATLKPPALLGGNCQAAIIALALARKMRNAGLPPPLLVLMEWGYSYGRYDEPVLLLYGRDSITAKFYAGNAIGGFDWRADFPCHVVAPISGTHGEFFNPENIADLAKCLKSAVAQPKRQRLARSFQN